MPNTVHTRAKAGAVGDRIPLVCTVSDVARIFGRSTSHIQRLKKAGRLNYFILPDIIGDGVARFCGRKLAAWAHGDLGHLQKGPRVFASKRGRRLVPQAERPSA